MFRLAGWLVTFLRPAGLRGNLALRVARALARDPALRFRPTLLRRTARHQLSSF